MKHSASIKQLLTVIILSGCVLMVPLTAMAAADNPLTGMYYGTAYITSPAELGTLDLAFYLDVTGAVFTAATSYVDLEKTLVFPKVAPQINGQDVGPRVSGTLSPAAFALATDVFTSRIGDKNVNRQITLTGDKIEDNGNSLSGTYTETITGMGPTPVVVSGTFLLAKPTVPVALEITDTNGDGCLDVDEIRAGGKDANVIEYSDVSYAMHLEENPSLTPNVCSEQVLQDVLTEYYGTLE